jgi:hypothetical protein
MFNDCIFQELQDFLGNKSSNMLLNLSKKFKAVKKVKYYWKLNYEHSRQYYREIDFKSRLESIFTRSDRQLSLDLRFFEG